MSVLRVVQREPGSGAATGGVVWRTCLREISFPAPEGGVVSDGRVFYDGAAYAYLLEVICGLDSPMSLLRSMRMAVLCRARKIP